MTTVKQNKTANDIIKNTQEKRQEKTPEKRALAQPDRGKRAKPGTTGEGEYYHIIVRPKGSFDTFRYQDVGDPGHILRHAGQRKSGSWETHAWLIGKEDAHVEGNKIVPDTEDARKLLEALGSVPTFVKGDIFEAKDRPDIPESEKPTEAQRKARTKKTK